MARKPRIEFPGAIYHVFNRGNYRKDLFMEPGSAAAFEESLFAVAEGSNWLLHAYTTMSNHFHVVVETPDANLSVGMHRLLTAFAVRFNRYHKEQGHVFQGRFKSPLVERGEPLRRVVDYVHLNPVRAGLVSVERLRYYPHCSYRKFWTNHSNPRLTRAGFLGQLGLPDNFKGMQEYEAWLRTREEGDPEKENQLREQFENCLIHGSAEFKESIQKKFEEMEPALDWGGSDVRELQQGQWESIVQEELKSRGKDEVQIIQGPKLAEWKVEISQRLRHQTTAPSRWIADRLNMGHPSNVGRYRKRVPKSKG